MRTVLRPERIVAAVVLTIVAVLSITQGILSIGAFPILGFGPPETSEPVARALLANILASLALGLLWLILAAMTFADWHAMPAMTLASLTLAIAAASLAPAGGVALRVVVAAGLLLVGALSVGLVRKRRPPG